MNWRSNRMSGSTDEFRWQGGPISDTSMAEAAARRMIDPETNLILINFTGSSFATVSVVLVEKIGAENVSLTCCDSQDAATRWADSVLGFVEYTGTERIPPQDRQTVLRDSFRFEPTGAPPQGGRLVYRERATGRRWYVDNLHYGRAAHLEVFDERGKHLGIASIDGKVDTSKVESDRRLRV